MAQATLQFPGPIVTESGPLADRETLAKQVGAEIKRLRRRMGVTQADAAAACFATDGMQAQWSRWERGEVVPQVSRLEAIARWAGVPMDVFGLDEATRGPSSSDLEAAKSLIRKALALLEGRTD